MLKNIKDKIMSGFKNSFNSKKSLGLGVFAVLLLVVSYYVFKTYLYPKLNPTYVSNKEFQQSQDNTVETKKEPDIAKIYYFYTQWCPFCKKARPEWDKAKEKFEGQVINNYKIHFLEVDCDAKTNEEMVKDIEGYPTIKLFLPDGKAVEYDSKPDSETLALFINSVLND